MQIFFSVGEPSGDLHGANLIGELRRQSPHVRVVGYGGPKMAAAGCELHTDLTRFAVMWFARVLTKLPTFWRLLEQADRYFAEARPDAVVLIDYPGFNWWIARRAKAHGIPVYYYGTPQMWAWAGWRIGKMRRLVDHALCKLPFEETWYRSRGVNATYVGHPYFDELASRRVDQEQVREIRSGSGPLVALLPGSRTQEVTANLRWMLKAAEEIKAHVDTVSFAVAAFKPEHALIATELAARTSIDVDVYVRQTPEVLEAADCCIAVSGSVSLELLYHARPSVVLYVISPLAFRVQKWFRKVKYITLVNLLACDDRFTQQHASYDPLDPADANVPIPEYLTCTDRSADLARHVIQWLTDAQAYQAKVDQLIALRDRVGFEGASRRAAAFILHSLQRTLAPTADAA